MSDAPETIWADPPEIFDGCDIWRDNPVNPKATKYRRADLPAPDPMDDPRVQALVDAVKSAGCYAGMDLARIEAALAAMEPDNG